MLYLGLNPSEIRTASPCHGVITCWSVDHSCTAFLPSIVLPQPEKKNMQIGGGGGLDARTLSRKCHWSLMQTASRCHWQPAFYSKHRSFKNQSFSRFRCLPRKLGWLPYIFATSTKHCPVSVATFVPFCVAGTPLNMSSTFPLCSNWEK